MGLEYQEADDDKFTQALDFLAKKYFGEEAMFVASVCVKNGDSKIKGSHTHSNMPPHIVYQVVSNLTVDLGTSGDVNPKFVERHKKDIGGITLEAAADMRDDLAGLVSDYENINLAALDLETMKYIVGMLKVTRKLSKMLAISIT